MRTLTRFALAIVAVALATPAQADLVTYNFSSSISVFDDGPAADYFITPGTANPLAVAGPTGIPDLYDIYTTWSAPAIVPVTGSMTWDTVLEEITAFSMTFDLGGGNTYTYDESLGTAASGIFVFDDEVNPDTLVLEDRVEFELSVELPNNFFSPNILQSNIIFLLAFWGDTSTIGSTDVPASTAELNAFSNRMFGFYVRGYEGGSATDIEGMITGGSTPEPIIPEPTTLALLGLGVAGLGIRRYRARA